MSLPTPPPYEPVTDDQNQPGRSWRHELAVAAAIVVVLEIAALPVGLIWGHVAPHTQYYTGGHQLNLVVGDAKPLVRGDAWFLLVTGIAGLIAGIVAFFVVKRAEIGATLGLAIGGLAAGWLTWRIGHAWTGGTQPITLALTPDNTKAKLAADLGARTVLVSWAVAAVAAHGLLYAITWPAKPKVEPVVIDQPMPTPVAPPEA